MRVVRDTYALNNFESIIQMVGKEKYPVTVESDCGNVVIIAAETYNELVEIVYLLGNHANVKHLMESMDQYKAGNIVELNE